MFKGWFSIEQQYLRLVPQRRWATQGVDWLVFVALNIAPCVVVQLCGTYQRSLGYGDAQASGQGLWHHKKQGGEVGGPAAAALI
jgi:hypothetical protein